jgi:hypothetical protein
MPVGIDQASESVVDKDEIDMVQQPVHAPSEPGWLHQAKGTSSLAVAALKRPHIWPDCTLTGLEHEAQLAARP